MLRSLRIDKFVHNTYNLYMTRTSSRIFEDACYDYIKFQIRYCNLIANSKLGTEQGKKPRKKTIRIPNIKLIYPDGSMIITLLQEAQKIAKSRNLHLQQESYHDTDGRDVYKLLGTTDIFQDKANKNTTKNPNESNKFKTTKYFQIQSKIAKHDLEIKLDHINKLLKRNYKIKLVITFVSDKVDKETMLKDVKGEVQGKLIEETKKGNSIICLYQPLLIESSNADENIS